MESSVAQLLRLAVFVVYYHFVVNRIWYASFALEHEVDNLQSQTVETQILQEVDLLDGVLSRSALKQVHPKLVLNIGFIVSRVLDHRRHIGRNILAVFGVGSMVAGLCTPFTPYFEAVHRYEFLDDLVVAGILHLP